MDFSVEQKAIPFMYVLTSTTEALLEYTLFSPAFDKENTNRRQYIETLGIQNFKIIEKKVFMTYYPFWKKTTKRPEYETLAGGLKRYRLFQKNSDRNHPS
jgi:hypothetical protein